MFNISESANALYFSFLDSGSSNQTIFVVQTDTEATDAEILDLVDQIKNSDYVQNRTGATAALDSGVQIARLGVVTP